MRTHIDLDDELLRQVIALGGFPNKTRAVNSALEAYINWRRRQDLLGLRGRVRWQGDLDKLRRDRTRR